MKFRPILLAWFLLLGATLAMGGGAWWLLDREADRVETLAAGVVANGAASVAESVDLLMEEIRTGVIDGLLAARRSPQPRSGLAEFIANNPYVQTGFYFRASDGVTSWYGPRADAPSPTALQSEDADQSYPWSLNGDDTQDVVERTKELPLVYPATLPAAPPHSAPTPKERPQTQYKGNAAPTDVIQAESSDVVQEVVEYDMPQEPVQQEYFSKSKALKRQRESVRQLNIDNRIAVMNQSIVLDDEAEQSSGSSLASQEESASQSSAFQSANADSVDFLSSLSTAGSSTSVGDDSDSQAASTSAVAVQSRGNNQFLGQISNVDSGAFVDQENLVGTEKKETQLAESEPEGFSITKAEDLAKLDELARRIKVILPQRPRTGWVRQAVKGVDQWLAWVDLPGQDNILGVWLNRDIVIAEIAKTISISQLKDVQFALVDAAGNRVAGAGGDHYSRWENTGPELTLSIGAALPGWHIEAYPALLENPFGRSFRLLGGVAVAGLSIAILLGGSLLLWQAQRDAHEAQRKTTFVANVSHELKTPLTSIRLFAEMLYDGRAGDETKQRRYLQTMLNETQRLTRLVNNVLDFSRLERGRRDFQQESVDAIQAVRDILEAQRDRLAGEGLTVDFVAPERPLKAMVDRDALEQILLNLLDNAAKYAASGQRAEVRLEQATSAWTLSVCDFGPGIPPRERQQVFEAFHRIDDRLTAERPGCGLGLSIAARLARGLGGQLTLQANQPTGCCFKLTVPTIIA
ncbi:sensor histidine kinase [Cerasicoccus arenae]|uniref:histidine kinase n=1 Tax=Cerasicoccus arenae TaxID=424488 RepID=A0A8J3DDS6_9BACT|nr:HAMP domain-containing sensor histidine kinase [Cerasicoccus arenae]MBK1859006.1 HAMP domain-containing histidine kinase [Cerasicoccus arenae]GHB94660.1 hypothetical protein GCM10007047_07720 [Cerasicoccus arenae]